MKVESLRDRFDKRGFAVNKYARAYGVNPAILTQVLDGNLNGKQNIDSSVRKIIAQLRNDGVFVGKKKELK